MSTDPRFTLDRLRTAAVIGAGTMGHGIAQVLAQAGLTTALVDAKPGAADAGVAKVRANLDKGVSLGKVAAADRDAAVARLTAAPSMAAACADVDLVIEAVPERLDLKRSLLAEIDPLATRALIATNTSSLPVADIAAALADPSRLVGMHFFNPVHIMKLCEVVRHADADPSAVACAVALATRLGKTAITVRDSPGFASSRLGLALGLEAMRMLEQDVASAADIDTAMKLGYGHPMGPLELTDQVGLDVRLGIADYLTSVLGPAFTAPEILRQKVAAGHLGRKSGQGFYTWGPGGIV
ncbi:MAG: 3-hydroxyacyl-CoA dehydrogenase family protein [Kofleriaceae bacterium]